jgi:bifunctional non-homologous end joining protein LigD
MLKPGFVEPMECQSAEKLPTGSGWLYEIKLDGYRMLAVRNAKTELYSRLKNSNTKSFRTSPKRLLPCPRKPSLMANWWHSIPRASLTLI